MQSEVHPYRVETTLSEDGTLTLGNLPFRAGDNVEVIVLPQSSLDGLDRAYSLEGLPLEYDRPFEGVGVDDWNAAP